MTVIHTKLICCTLVLLFLYAGFILPQSAAADHLSAPEHYITMEFDLQNNSFQANSRINLPPGTSLHLDLSHLSVSRIIINGQPATSGPDNDTLDIQPSAKEQEILLTYSKTITPGTSPYDIISETGITLIDNWYPVANQEMFFKLTAYIPENFEAVSEADEIITFQVENRNQVNIVSGK